MTRVLVACEFSGAIATRMAARGYETLSVDFRPAEHDGPHHRGDVLEVLDDPSRFFTGPIDLMVAHPPCTHLSVSGARYHAAKWADGRIPAALDFVRALLAAPVPHIALENPVSIISGQIRKADQTVQPWQFGHGERKATCWWLKNLPKLQPTNVLPERGPNGEDWREAKVHRMSPGPDRERLRSLTYPGIAQAAADQWGPYVEAAAR